jgi:broad specificity phosphatase PhoE
LELHQQVTDLKIILARHGDAKNTAGKFHGMKDEPITSKGRSEAYQLAKELKQYHATMIYYSPLSRTRDTAKILGSELAIPTREAPELKPLDNGQFTGKHINKTSIEMLKHYLNNPDVTIPGGQSVNDWARQYLPFFERLFKRKSYKNSSDNTIIFMTHGRNIILTNAYLHGSGLAPNFDKALLVDNKLTTEHGGYAVATPPDKFQIIDSKPTVAGTS